jgi:hypothetical protein
MTNVEINAELGEKVVHLAVFVRPDPKYRFRICRYLTEFYEEGSPFQHFLNGRILDQVVANGRKQEWVEVSNPIIVVCLFQNLILGVPPCWAVALGIGTEPGFPRILHLAAVDEKSSIEQEEIVDYRHNELFTSLIKDVRPTRQSYSVRKKREE